MAIGRAMTDAELLREVAREIEVAVQAEEGKIQYGGPMFRRDDATRLRALAETLGRVTAEHAQRARWRAEYHAKHARQWREDATRGDFTEEAAREREADARVWAEMADILAALAGGTEER